MIRNIHRTWYEIWGSEEAQNKILKLFLLLLALLCTVLTAALVILSLRRPLVIALTPTQTKALAFSEPGPELLQAEVTRVLSAFVTDHNTWTWDNIDDQLTKASRLVSPSFATQFLKANASQQQIAKEKKLAQKFLISEATVDLKQRRGRIAGDRILIVDGLRATNPMTFEIGFEFGARTEQNPEGIYVTNETLLNENPK